MRLFALVGTYQQLTPGSQPAWNLSRPRTPPKQPAGGWIFYGRWLNFEDFFLHLTPRERISVLPRRCRVECVSRAKTWAQTTSQPHLPRTKYSCLISQFKRKCNASRRLLHERFHCGRAWIFHVPESDFFRLPEVALESDGYSRHQKPYIQSSRSPKMVYSAEQGSRWLTCWGEMGRTSNERHHFLNCVFPQRHERLCVCLQKELGVVSLQVAQLCGSK